MLILNGYGAGKAVLDAMRATASVLFYPVNRKLAGLIVVTQYYDALPRRGAVRDSIA